MKKKIIEVSYLQTNCIVFWDEETRKSIVVDPGGKSEKLIEFIEGERLNVTHILITHGHFDHVGGVKYCVDILREKGHLPKVCMHGLENEDMEAGAKSQYRKDFFDVDVDLQEMDKLDLGFIAFDLIVIAGHTRYSVCFYNKEEKLLLSGDTLFYRTVGTPSYYPGPDTDLRKYIKEKLLVLPEDVTVIPGHGETTTIGDEKRMNPFLIDGDDMSWLE